MKHVLWMVGGFCAAAAGFLAFGPSRTQPVELLAHRLEKAWADIQTVSVRLLLVRLAMQMEPADHETAAQ